MTPFTTLFGCFAVYFAGKIVVPGSLLLPLSELFLDFLLVFPFHQFPFTRYVCLNLYLATPVVDISSVWFISNPFRFETFLQASDRQLANNSILSDLLNHIEPIFIRCLLLNLLLFESGKHFIDALQVICFRIITESFVYPHVLEPLYSVLVLLFKCFLLLCSPRYMFQQILMVQKHYLQQLLYQRPIFTCADYGVNLVRYDALSTIYIEMS